MSASIRSAKASPYSAALNIQTGSVPKDQPSEPKEKNISVSKRQTILNKSSSEAKAADDNRRKFQKLIPEEESQSDNEEESDFVDQNFVMRNAEQLLLTSKSPGKASVRSKESTYLDSDTKKSSVSRFTHAKKQAKPSSNLLSPNWLAKEAVAEVDRMVEQEGLQERRANKIFSLPVPEQISHLLRDVYDKLTPNSEVPQSSNKGKLSTKSDVYGREFNVKKKFHPNHFKENENNHVGKLSTRSEITGGRRARGGAKLKDMINTLLDDSEYEIQIEVTKTSIKKKPEKSLGKKSRDPMVIEDIDRDELAVQVGKTIAEEWDDDSRDDGDASSTDEPQNKRLARLSTKEMVEELSEDEVKKEVENEVIRVNVPEGYSEEDEEEQDQMKNPLSQEEEALDSETLSKRNLRHAEEPKQEEEEDIEYIEDLGESEDEMNIRLSSNIKQQEDQSEENYREDQADQINNRREIVISDESSHPEAIEVRAENTKMDEEGRNEIQRLTNEMINVILEEGDNTMNEESLDYFKSPEATISRTDLIKIYHEDVNKKEQVMLNEENVEPRKDLEDQDDLREEKSDHIVDLDVCDSKIDLVKIDEENTNKNEQIELIEEKIESQQNQADHINIKEENLDKLGETEVVNNKDLVKINDENINNGQQIKLHEEGPRSGQDCEKQSNNEQDPVPQEVQQKDKDGEEEPTHEDLSANNGDMDQVMEHNQEVEVEESQLHPELHESPIRAEILQDEINQNKPIINDLEVEKATQNLEAIEEDQQVEVVKTVAVVRQEYTFSFSDPCIQSQDFFNVIVSELFVERKEAIVEDQIDCNIPETIKSDDIEGVDASVKVQDAEIIVETQLPERIDEHVKKEISELEENTYELEAMDQEDVNNKEVFAINPDDPEVSQHREELYQEVHDIVNEQNNTHDVVKDSLSNSVDKKSPDLEDHLKEEESTSNLFDAASSEAMSEANKEDQNKLNLHQTGEDSLDRDCKKLDIEESTERGRHVEEVYNTGNDEEDDIGIYNRDNDSKDHQSEVQEDFTGEMMEGNGDEKKDQNKEDQEHKEERGSGERSHSSSRQASSSRHSDNMGGGYRDDKDQSDDEEKNNRRNNNLADVPEAVEDKESEHEKSQDEIEEVDQVPRREEQEEEPEKSGERKEYSVYEDWRLFEALDDYISRNGEDGSKSKKTWETITDPKTKRRLLNKARSGESMRNRVRRTLSLLSEDDKDKIRHWIKRHSEEDAKNHFCRFEKYNSSSLKKFIGVFDKPNFTFDHASKKAVPSGQSRAEAPVRQQNEGAIKHSRRGRNAGELERAFYEDDSDSESNTRRVEVKKPVDNRMRNFVEAQANSSKNRVQQEEFKHETGPMFRLTALEDHLIDHRSKTQREQQQQQSQVVDQRNKQNNNNPQIRVQSPIKSDNTFKFATKLNRIDDLAANDQVVNQQRNTPPVILDSNIDSFVDMNTRRETKKRKEQSSEEAYETHNVGIKKVKSVNYYEKTSMVISNAFKQKKTIEVNISNSELELLAIYVDHPNNFRQFVWNEEEDLENSQVMTQNSVLERLNQLARKSGMPTDKIFMYFEKTSFDFDDLELYLSTRDDSILWDPDEDRDLLQGNSTALRYLQGIKGMERVMRRKEFLINRS